MVSAFPTSKFRAENKSINLDQITPHSLHFNNLLIHTIQTNTEAKTTFIAFQYSLIHLIQTNTARNQKKTNKQSITESQTRIISTTHQDMNK